MNPLKRHFAQFIVFSAIVAASPAVLACSSCGCSLSSDWASQGYTAGAGFHVDLRYDYFNQDQLRSGTGTVDRGGIAFPADREIQQKTINRNTTLALDYGPNADWAINVQIPYFDRFHTTIAPGDTDISTSDTESLGDVRVLGRYQGFSADHSVGIQVGLKFPTGAIHNNFIDGPQAGNPLDRGLQPGTGTTDLLIGVYHFGTINRDWDYFGQALFQQPLNSKEGFRPGAGLNLNTGIRYVAHETFAPQLQLNVRTERRESGVNADVANSGATLVHLSPGLTINVGNSMQFYGFVQLPLYQRVNGYQIEPRYSVSFGVHYSM